MKRLIFFIIVIFTNTSFCQIPVKKLSLQEKEVIVEYIKNAYKNGLFFKDKGVIKITDMFNESGAKTWSLTLLLDAYLNTNFPTSYSKYRNDVILFYEKSTNKLETSDSTIISSFFKEIIGDRLFPTTPKINRPMTLTIDGFMDSDEVLYNGKKPRVIEDDRRLSLDGDKSVLYVTFLKNGLLAKSYFGIDRSNR